VIWRKATTGAVLGASAVLLSGCVVFKSAPTAKQKKNSVVITVKGCASGMTSSPPPGSCPKQGNGNSSDLSDPSQVFLGFRVPASSKPPKSFTAKTGPVSGGPTLHFLVFSSYKSQLQKNFPAPRGQKWVGYRTKYFNYSNSSGQQNFSAKVAFALSKSAKGSLKYEVVLGGRVTNNTTPNPAQSVNCMGQPKTVHSAPGAIWICDDDSAKGSLKLH
jgi:hypothetical protein